MVLGKIVKDKIVMRLKLCLVKNLPTAPLIHGNDEHINKVKFEQLTMLIFSHTYSYKEEIPLRFYFIREYM